VVVVVVVELTLMKIEQVVVVEQGVIAQELVFQSRPEQHTQLRLVVVVLVVLQMEIMDLLDLILY
jgi:hypothetical protein